MSTLNLCVGVNPRMWLSVFLSRDGLEICLGSTLLLDLSEKLRTLQRLWDVSIITPKIVPCITSIIDTCLCYSCIIHKINIKTQN